MVQKLICRTQISNGVDRLDPNTTRKKANVYLDRLFLLSNLTWRRAHVMAESGRDPNINVFCSIFVEDKKLDSNLHIW